jgi:putative methionine-R-sulfoxide reductase with GAF domain
MSREPFSDRDKLLAILRDIVSAGDSRVEALQAIADTLRQYGSNRWVGLYDVDSAAGMVKNIVWSGPGAPACPTFPSTKGLTASAIASRKSINVGDVTGDPRYLTAFGSTRSEIIVPVMDRAGRDVVGTIDVESETPNAFSEDVQKLLEACADAIRPLWELTS